MEKFKKKLPVVILAVALVIALILALVANNGKNAAIDANTQLTALLEEISTTATDLQGQVDTTTADLEAKTAELTTAQTDLEATTAAKAEAETKAAELEAKLAETEAAVTAAETAKADVETAKAEAETKAAELEAKLAETEAAVTASEAAKADVEAAKAEVETKAAELEAKLAESETAKAAAEAQNIELAAAAADLETKLAAAGALTTVPELEGKLVILHTNDIHGRAVVADDAFGYARIATLKKNLEAMGASVLLVDAGDFSQGTPVVNIGYGKNAVAFLNAAGYDIAILGNHELDWGFDNMYQNMTDAEFDILCANLTRTAGGDLVFPANKIIELPNGVKAGFFGLSTPETMTKTHPDKVKGITISMNEALYADAQKQVDELTAAGCDLIVCLSHLGDAEESIPNRSVDMLNNVTGIDVCIDGHSHTTIDGGKMYGDTVLTSTGSYSEAIGYVIVDIAKADGETTKTITAGLYTLADDTEALLATGSKLAVDEEVAAIVNAIDAEIEAALSDVFATTEVLLNGERSPGVRTEETNLGDFACDAILWAAKQALGEDAVHAALTNGGGIRASIQAGPVTMKDMKTVFPYGNEVAVVTLKGSELLEALEAATFCTPEAVGAFPQVAGIEFTIDTTVAYTNGALYDNSTYYAPAAPGTRVTITTVAGEPFDPEKDYVIATNDFTAAGGDTYGALAYPFKQSGYKTGVALEDALVTYTQQVLDGVIGAQYAAPQGRITIK